jgi:virginiamycin B lyase
MWFAAAGAGVQAIGRITSAGAISEFKTPPSVTSLNGGITEGSDGALWFTHDGNVGRLTTEGKFSDYVVSSSKRTEQITSGPDGSLWFTEIPYLVIGRLSTSGSLSEFSLLDGSGQLNGITSGPDGALWFTVTDTDNSAEYIGRLSTSGSATFYRLDTTGSIDPLEIVAGPNSALYFGQGAESQGIGKITTTGSFQEFPLSSASALDITLGPDGDLWFTDGRFIGRISASGSSQEIFATPSNYGVAAIATGPDGAIYLTEYDNKVGRVVLQK